MVHLTALTLGLGLVASSWLSVNAFNPNTDTNLVTYWGQKYVSNLRPGSQNRQGISTLFTYTRSAINDLF